MNSPCNFIKESIVKTRGPPRSQMGQIHLVRMGIQISLDGLHGGWLSSRKFVKANIFQSYVQTGKTSGALYH